MSYTWPLGRMRTRGPEGTGLSRPGETAVLAAALVAGLVVVAPSLAWLLATAGLPAPLPLLAGVGVVGGLYGAALLVLDRLARGAVVATVVTATFAADVPLLGGTGGYPGSLEPAVWLVHLPMLVLVAILSLRGSLDSITRVEYALGAFVVWSAVVALVGPVLRPDVALLYALFSLYCLVALAVATRSVANGLVSLRGFCYAFLVAVGGHVAYAFVQLVNQDVLGLSMLGETTRAWSHTVVPLGPLGAFNVGVFVSGFAGGSGSLSILIVLALPIALAVAARRAGTERVGLLLCVAAATAVLRFTEKDAARAAAMIAMAGFGAFLLWEHRSRLGSLRARSRAVRRWAAPLALAVGVLFVPSTIVASGDGGSGGGGSTGGSGGGSVVGGKELSIPFFNLETLGVRLQQYVVGLDLFATHPILGIGGGNFRYAAARYDAPALEGVSMHNLYLSVLVGTGLVGFVLYSAAVLLVLGSGVRLLRSPATDRLLVAGVLAALVGYCMALFWVLPLRFTYALPFWLLAGALVGRWLRPGAPATDVVDEGATAG